VTKSATTQYLRKRTLYSESLAPTKHALEERGEEKGEGQTYHGPIPTGAPACKHNSMKYSSVCSCWGYTANATTLWGGVRTTTVYAPTPICRRGIEWSFYYLGSPTLPNNDDFKYSAFTQYHLDLIKGKTPTLQGTTSVIGTPSLAKSGSGAVVYGKSYSKHEYIIVQHRGYLQAKEAGEYKFKFSNEDEVAFLWVGGKAHDEWNLYNYDLKNYYLGPTSEFTYTARAGEIIPFRIVFVNAQGDLSLTVDVFKTSTPQNKYLSKDSPPNEHILQYCENCDNKAVGKARRWLPWADERAD
jgi:hypothetical protein